MSKNILFIYNEVSKKQKVGLFRECTLDSDVKEIREALKETKCNILSLDLNNPKQLNNFIVENEPVDFAFVLAEGYKDCPHTLYNGSGAARIRKQLEAHKVPFSHSSIKSMEICRNKDSSYQVLKKHNIPVPEHFVFDPKVRFSNEQLLEEINRIGYPLMIKPTGGGDSIGITPKSVVNNLAELKNKISYLKRTLGPQKLIIEQYLTGQEFTIGVLVGENIWILPIVAFPKNWGIRYTRTKNKEYRMQNQFKIVDNGHPLFSPLIDITRKSIKAVQVSDIIRLDVKKDARGNLYVIDINGNPGLSRRASVAFMASKAGLSYSQLIWIILFESMVRNGVIPDEYFQELIEPIKKRLNPYIVNKKSRILVNSNLFQ